MAGPFWRISSVWRAYYDGSILLSQDALLYVLTAFGLGALHSFEPAHGKAILAAYLVGRSHRLIEAVLFGLIIALAHTFSILALGSGAWFVSSYYQITLTDPMVSLVGGILVLIVGFWMLIRWRKGVCPHPGHGHHDHHQDDHAQHNGAEPSKTSFGQLALVGIGGGLVPCPSGVAMLMTAVAAGQPAQGLSLAVSFSLGAGMIVILLSILIQKSSSLLSSWLSDDQPVLENLPLISSLVIIAIGIWLAGSAFLDLVIDTY